MAISVGIDVGGTFTDFALSSDRVNVTRKLLTTPDDPSVAIFEGLDLVLRAADVDYADVERVVHGTTLVSNTLIQRMGARCALLTTAGFRDVLEIGRGFRYDNYDLQLEFPEPLIPRRYRIDIRERIGSDGSVVTPLHEDDVWRAVKFLGSEDLEAVAICFLHSYLDGTHERRAREIVQSTRPDLPISLSSEVVPEIGEYERLITTIADAYVRPVMERYLTSLERGLAERGFRGDLYVMRSDRGLATAANARRVPIHHLESGPAAGATASGSLAAELGFKRAIAFDMGGTTAKAAFVDDGRPAEAYGLEVARVHLFKAGSGLFLRSPAVEQVEVGAGGGSIARVDPLNALAVGPQSAGSRPGPASYNRGGKAPTVTDANLLLGYLDPVTFANGAIQLSLCRAEEAMDRLAADLAIDRESLARGIRDLADESMSHAFNTHCAEKGIDPRGRVLIAFGGGGPLHAESIARRMHVSTIVVPPNASVFSAIGLLQAPLTFISSRTHRIPVDEIEPDVAEAIIGTLAREATAHLGGVPGAESSTTEATADMRYAGQRHLVTVRLGPLPAEPIRLRNDLRSWFEEEYGRQYGHPGLRQPIEIVTWRVRVSAGGNSIVWRAEAAGSGAEGPRSDEQLHVTDPTTVRKIRRGTLMPGDTVYGPALIDEGDAVTYLGPNARATVHVLGSLVINIDYGGGDE